MSDIKVVMATNESTVVAEYTPDENKKTSYQSEADLEREFIEILKSQSYEYVTIKSEQPTDAAFPSIIGIVAPFTNSNA